MKEDWFDPTAATPTLGAVRSYMPDEAQVRLEGQMAELAARVAALEGRPAGAVRLDAGAELAELRRLVENTITTVGKAVGVTVPRN